MKRKQTITNWLPALIWMAAIYFISNQPTAELPNLGLWDLLFKKGAHFGAYAILAVFVSRGIGVEKRPFFLPLIIAILYAASDEYHQTFVAGRNGTAKDVLLDASGAFAGLLVLQFWLKQKLAQSATVSSDPP
jgi:VanZ family protein